MTPLRAKYIRDLVIHGRSKHTQEACTRYVCDLARYYRRSPELISYGESHGLAVPSHQVAPTVSLQRQHRRQRRALSLRRYTWARDARPDGIGLGHEARHRARGQRGRIVLYTAPATTELSSLSLPNPLQTGPGHSWPLKTPRRKPIQGTSVIWHAIIAVRQS